MNTMTPKRSYTAYGLFKLLGYIWLAWGPIALDAQQEQLYTQFFYNKLAYNPGYAGSFQSPTLIAVVRNQWIGLEGAPNTQLISYTQPALNGRVGLGLQAVRNSIGITQTITTDIAYAYRIALRRGHLGVGLQASVRHLHQNWSDPRLVGSQPLMTDGAIPSGPQTKVLPNFGTGVYYEGPNWYVGAAVPRLVSNNIDFAELGGLISREVRHINAMGGVSFDLGNSLVLTPQVLLKYVENAPFDADINAILGVGQRFWSGLTYRVGGGKVSASGESLDVLAGVQATDNLFFAVSYDIGLTRLRKFNNGSVEATVRWWFNPPKGSEVINPRNPTQ